MNEIEAGVATELIGLVGIIATGFFGWLGVKVNNAAKDIKKTRVNSEKTQQDAAQTREQTVNNHAEAEFPNLRDELTAVHETTRANLEANRKMAEALEKNAEAVRKLTAANAFQARKTIEIESQLTELYEADKRRAEYSERQTDALEMLINSRERTFQVFSENLGRLNAAVETLQKGQ